MAARAPEPPPRYDGASIGLVDLAPDGGAAPCVLQVEEHLAAELIAASPARYRLAKPGEPVPTERADGKLVQTEGQGG